MYAIIRRYRLAEGASVEALMHGVQQGFAPIVADAPGFVAFHALDLGGGRIASVSVFDGQESAEASTRLAADHIQAELARFFAGPPEIEQGPVGAHVAKAAGEVPHLESGQPLP